MSSEERVTIVGAGIGGLTLALELHAAGIECRVYEAVPEVSAVGVGINVLPHATRVLDRLGLLDDLARAAITTSRPMFFNRSASTATPKRWAPPPGTAGPSSPFTWVVEDRTAQHVDRDWNRRGRLPDFAGTFADWHFDWLDVRALFAAAQTVLEYPMVDQDPLDWGACPAPLDPRGTIGCAASPSRVIRPPATAAVVQANRTNPPDAILREVYRRTGDRPFQRIEDVISQAELDEIIAGYQRTAGYSVSTLQGV